MAGFILPCCTEPSEGLGDGNHFGQWNFFFKFCGKTRGSNHVIIMHCYNVHVVRFAVSVRLHQLCACAVDHYSKLQHVKRELHQGRIG